MVCVCSNMYVVILHTCHGETKIDNIAVVSILHTYPALHQSAMPPFCKLIIVQHNWLIIFVWNPVCVIHVYEFILKFTLIMCFS